MNNQIEPSIRGDEHPLGDFGQGLFFIFFLVLWILDSFVFKWTTFLSGYIPLAIRMLLLGISLYFVFYISRQAHVVVLNRNAKLITDGVFSRVRHPIYLAMLLLYLGLSLSVLSLLSMGLWVLIFLFYNYIAGYEEKYLLSKYGKEYVQYKEKVRRWIPIVKRNS
ncbi:MAG: methyltransferase family protein [Bacillota bacterium]